MGGMPALGGRPLLAARGFHQGHQAALASGLYRGAEALLGAGLGASRRGLRKSAILTFLADTAEVFPFFMADKP